MKMAIIIAFATINSNDEDLIEPYNVHLFLVTESY